MRQRRIQSLKLKHRQSSRVNRFCLTMQFGFCGTVSFRSERYVFRGLLHPGSPEDMQDVVEERKQMNESLPEGPPMPKILKKWWMQMSIWKMKLMRAGLMTAFPGDTMLKMMPLKSALQMCREMNGSGRQSG